MKKMLAIAVAAALAAPVAVMADTTLCGKLNTSIGSVERSGGDSEVEVANIASRLGVKGSTPLDNGLDATYMIEFGIDPDGDGDTVSKRDQWVGLKGGFGEVRVGRHGTPNKLSSAVIDNFPDTYADSSYIVKDRSANNAIAYLNKFGPVGVAVATVTDAGDDEDGVEGTAANSLSLAYGSPKKGLYAGLGYEDIEDTQQIAKLSGQYTFPGGHKANVVYETQDNSDAGDVDQDTLIVGGGFKVANAMVKAQYAKTDIDDDAAADLEYATFGVNYKLGKKTNVYFLYHDKDVDGVDAGDLNATAVGIRHTF